MMMVSGIAGIYVSALLSSTLPNALTKQQELPAVSGMHQNTPAHVPMCPISPASASPAGATTGSHHLTDMGTRALGSRDKGTFQMSHRADTPSAQVLFSDPFHCRASFSGFSTMSAFVIRHRLYEFYLWNVLHLCGHQGNTDRLDDRPEDSNKIQRSLRD